MCFLVLHLLVLLSLQRDGESEELIKEVKL